MCGISGLVTLQDPLPVEVRACIGPMTQALSHRGPDAEGILADEYAALGHRRLSIIDRAGGEQPMGNEDGSLWIVFNGEVYNHRELRKELELKGHVFRTRSDTEAIIHAYEEYGAACVEKFNGMFAFAIYDRKRRELFAARDHLGKKPFYYGAFSGVLHFASEIKALTQSVLWDGTLDISGLETYLALGYFLAPATIYRHVRMLEPGHWLLLRAGKLTFHKYWDVIQFDARPAGGESDVAAVDALLADAVHARLESEVPLGAFLSGGIDSGLIVSYMAEKLGAGITTSTIGFGDASHNELAAAQLTASRYATAHHAHVVEPHLDDVLDTIVTAFDQPFADSSAIPTYYVSALTRRHVTVALSGDGGDEVFGGYDFRYVPHAIECSIRAAPFGEVIRRSAGWLGRRWPRSRRLPHPLRLGTVLENIGRTAEAAYFFDLCFLKPPDARALLGSQAEERDMFSSRLYESVIAPYRACSSPSPIQRAQYADLKTYLPNDVLVKVDRMSMLHGLEVRSPLLDRRLVELAFGIPTARKMPRLRAKHILRTLGKRRLPRTLLRLPKHGFTAPVGSWIAGPYKAAFRDEVLGSGATVRDYLDSAVVERLLEAHSAGREDRSYVLWAIWVLERWGRKARTLRRSPGAAARRPVEAAPR